MWFRERGTPADHLIHIAVIMRVEAIVKCNLLANGDRTPRIDRTIGAVGIWQTGMIEVAARAWQDLIGLGGQFAEVLALPRCERRQIGTMHDAPVEPQDAIARMEVATGENTPPFLARLSNSDGIIHRHTLQRGPGFAVVPGLMSGTPAAQSGQ